MIQITAELTRRHAYLTRVGADKRKIANFVSITQFFCLYCLVFSEEAM